MADLGHAFPSTHWRVLAVKPLIVLSFPDVGVVFLGTAGHWVITTHSGLSRVSGIGQANFSCAGVIPDSDHPRAWARGGDIISESQGPANTL
jgi:hypothetical protein